MKKRLRKKKHLGEFRKYGFVVVLYLDGSRDKFDVFADFTKIVHSYGWQTGGFLDKARFTQIVCEECHGSGMHEKQRECCSRLVDIPSATHCDVWLPVDCYYDDEQFDVYYKAPDSYAFKLEKQSHEKVT